ncbi:hypothetical protein [Fangia hongkongensis]|uniref:hypothetical protein n=2 Tax=Fangia hongkongensis TaxID=270495 RepID=UPI00037365B9|nr:hypothetical protein [Fangia hongkongensis]
MSEHEFLDNYQESDYKPKSDQSKTDHKEKAGDEKGKAFGFKFEKIYIGYAIAAAVFVYGIYIIVNSLMASSSTETPNIQKTPITQLSSRHFTPIKQKTDMRFQQDQQQIERLNKSMIVNQQQLKKMEEALNKQTQILQKWSESFNHLDKSVIALEAAIKTYFNKADRGDLSSLKSLSNELRTEINGLKMQRLSLMNQWQLTAVVGDVAWLENKKGQSITVHVGSVLQGYGKVTRVDDESGQVFTSSGFIFD